MADNFFAYMMANFPTELVVMGAKTALTNYDLPLDASKMKSFDEFHKRFGQVCFVQQWRTRPSTLQGRTVSAGPAHPIEVPEVLQ